MPAVEAGRNTESVDLTSSGESCPRAVNPMRKPLSSFFCTKTYTWVSDYSEGIGTSNLMYEVRNRLLRLLPPDELKSVLLLAEEVPLGKRQVLHRYGVRMRHVYLIETSPVSVGAKVGPQEFVEVWLIGSEGLAGIH